MKTPLPPDFDLQQLARVPLDAHHARQLELALATCGGVARWSSRKANEAREVLALAQVSRRITVLAFDLREALRVHFLMRAPVPCLPDPAGELQIHGQAELVLCYTESAAIEPQPGYNFISLLRPYPAWHPNIATSAFGQRLCLGIQLPAATRVREIIILTYQALTLAAAQFNPFDPAMVANGAAAEWLQRNSHIIPLTKEPFIHVGDNHANVANT